MPKYLIRNRTRLVIVSILTIVIFFSIFPSIFTGIKNLSIKTILVPAKMFSGIAKYFESKRSLSEDNLSLRKNIGELNLEAERFKELQKENRRLRELLNFKNRIGFNTVSAEVIVRNPDEWIGSFIIDKGIEDGVEKNSAVCSAKGLLGKVFESGAKTSTVMLITHPGFKAGGMLKDTRINGIIVGGGKDVVKMLYIPIDAEVKKNSIIVTSGFSSIFPKGITIGVVVSVGKSKTGLYKYAIIKPSASSFDQEEVLCIK